MPAEHHDRRCVRRTARVAALALASFCVALAPSVAAAQGPATGSAATGAADAVLTRPTPTALLVWRERTVAADRLAAQAAWFADEARAEAAALALAAARSAQSAALLVEEVDGTAQADLASAEAAILASLAQVPAGPAPLQPAVAPVGAEQGAPRVDGGAPTTVPGDGSSSVLAAAAALEAAASDLFAQAMAAETLVSDVTSAATGETWGDLGELQGVLESVEEIAARLEGRASVTMTLPAPVADVVLDAWSGPGVDAGPWTNGAIPLSELCAPQVAPGAYLRCDAAEALDALSAAYRAEHGVDLGVVSGYRTFAEQALLRATLGSIAAPAGASNHGLGVAVDLAEMGGLGQFDAPAYHWMKANGPLFGWHHPTSMEPGGGGPQEPWHWEFVGVGR